MYNDNAFGNNSNCITILLRRCPIYIVTIPWYYTAGRFPQVLESTFTRLGIYNIFILVLKLFKLFKLLKT